MWKALALAAALTVVAVALFGYLVGRAVLAAGDAQRVANTALESTREHTLDYDHQFKVTPGAPSLSSNSNSDLDFAQYKQGADSFVAKVDQVRVEIQADRAKLDSADQLLHASGQNSLAAPVRSGVDRSKRRVESMMSALDAATTGLGIERDEMHATSAFMDVMIDYVKLDNNEKAGDVPGSLAVFTTLDPKLQTALQAVQVPDIPAQEGAGVKAIAAVIADEKAVLEATQAHDANRVRAGLTKFDTDRAALDKVDTSQIDSEEQALLQPYLDRYERDVKAAGFKLTSTGS